jgi:hypothetical protein
MLLLLPRSARRLNLQLARAYLKNLLENARVSKYLGQKHPDQFGQLRKIVGVVPRSVES